MVRSPETHNNEQRPGTQKPRDVRTETARKLGRVAIKKTGK